MLKKLVLAASLLLPVAAKAEILFDNIPETAPLQISGSHLFTGLTGSFAVPEGFLWDISSITLVIWQGAEGELSITLTDPFSVPLGVSSVTALLPLAEFVPTTFSFIDGVTLAPGTYDIVATYTHLDTSRWSHWDSGPDMLYRIEGSSSPIPEPSSFAALAGVAMLANALGRRRRA